MISINYRDPRPIYEQIKAGLRRLILTGAMGPEERLPSVRDLSSQLAVNPNTVQRAYRELEAEGYICSMARKGSFVAPDQRVDQNRIELLLRQFDEAAAELKFMGYSPEELGRRIQKGGNQV